MVKTSKTSSLLAAAAAAVVTTTTAATSTTTTAAAASRNRHLVASFGLPNHHAPSSGRAAFMRASCCQIPRGGDDDDDDDNAATRDDTNNNMEEEQHGNDAAAAEKAAPPSNAENEATSNCSSGHGKQRKKKTRTTRKKENAAIPKGEQENNSKSNTRNVPTTDGKQADDGIEENDEKIKIEPSTKPTKQKAASSSSSSSRGEKKEKDHFSSSAPAPAPKEPQAPPPKRSPIVEQILKEEDYYKILGIVNRAEIEKLSSSSDNDAAASIITKHYRKRALQTHPDKTGGDRRAFDKVAEAYDVLSDLDKRNVYNRFGKKGLDGSTGIGAAGGAAAAAASRHAEELFRSFFGGTGNPFFQQQQQQQMRPRNNNRTARYQLPVTLEDLYRGMTRSVLVAPPVEEEEETMIFGNMIYRRSKPRSSSSSQNKSKTVQVNIPRGALNGQTIVLSGEMDFDDTQTPGDIIFALATRPHATFTRKGHDLAMQHTISLRQALCGRRDDVVLIRHLNGQNIPLHLARRRTTIRRDKTTSTSSSSSQEQQQQQQEEEADQPCMIHDGDVQVVKGLGMPKDAQGTAFGDLYIQFKVAMPSSSSSLAKARHAASTTTELTLQERHELGRLLDKLLGSSSSSSPQSRGDDSETTATEKKDLYIMHKAKLADFGRASGTPRMPSSFQHDDDHHHADGDDDDDDEHYHPSSNNPFAGAGASQFFFSSMMGRGGPGGGRGTGNPFFSAAGSSSFSSSNHPFEDHDYPPHGDASQQDDHDENAQCRQM
jgi:DnaJ-class molecular chaperone